MARYSFSGHETFTCKSLWLKKGYDFLGSGHKFSDDDAVVHLGVGKNMVSSIRFWLRAFSLTVGDQLTPLAHTLFADSGKDPFAEDLDTLWLLHYQLVKSQVASIYSLLFLGLQRDMKQFTRDNIQSYIKRLCAGNPEQKNVYNENTVKKDIGVLLANYVTPSSIKSLEEYNALMLDLGLIRVSDNKYVFNQTNPKMVAPEVILYALLDYSGEDKTISLDKLQELALIFCLSLPDLILILQTLAAQYQNQILYTDNAGVKNIQIIGEKMNTMEVLDKIYKK